MNNSYTQVNTNQLNDILKSMQTAQRVCGNALNAFSSAMQMLANSGQIEGSALEAFNNNMTKIKQVYEKFDNYCGNVANDINGIISDEKSIESEFNKEYNDLLSVDPTNFNG